MSGESPTIVASVQADLKRIAKRSKELAEGSLAAVALNLARRIDDGDTSTHAAAVAAKELRELLTLIAALAPAEQRKDSLDELNSRRMARRATA